MRSEHGLVLLFIGVLYYGSNRQLHARQEGIRIDFNLSAKKGKAEFILIALHALYALNEKLKQSFEQILQSGQKTFGIETQHGKINWEALWAID